MPTTGTMKYLTIGDSTYEVYNTDTEVIQTYAAASGYTNWRPLVVGYSSNSSETTAPTTITGTTYTFNTIKVKPSDGIIRFGAAALYNGDYTTTISADTLTAARTLTAPDKSGTIALTSDIPSLTGYATTTYVDDAIAALPEPMLFKGSVGTGGTITSLPTAAAANEGFTYKVITALSTPVTAKVGDTVISTGSEWVVIPSGDEPSGTVTSVGLSNATDGGLSISGSPITSSGSITVGHTNVLTSAQTTQAVYPIKIDKNGHISAYGNAVTIPTIPSNNVTGIGSTDYLARWSGTNTLSSTSLYINTSYNSGSDEYGIIQLRVGSTGQIDWKGQLVLHDGSSSKTITITPPSLTTSRTITLPDKTGTIALTSDIPTVPSISLNGSSTTSASFYAPTTAGTSGQILTSNGSGAPTWTNAGSSTDEKLAVAEVTSGTTYYPIVGSGTTAATRQYDTTGFSYTANSIRSFITLGNNISEGTTGSKRGAIQIYGTADRYTQLETLITSTGAGQNTGVVVNFPNKGGTIALTDDIPTVPTKTSDLTNDSGFLTAVPASGVTAGTYDGGATKNIGFYFPSFTVDNTGRITSATDLGTLIPVVTNSNSSNGGNLVGAWSWALATRSYTAYPSILAAGNTSQTITISSDSNSAYTYNKDFRVVDVEAFDAVTKEPVIVDWSVNALYSNNSSVTVTVSIASAYTNNIWLYVLLSVGYGSM